jgi:hypothetical protein
VDAADRRHPADLDNQGDLEMKALQINRNSNPRMLDLLKAGFKIEFPDGRWMEGACEGEYIHIGCGEDGYLGSWSCDRDGLRNALSDNDFLEVVAESE